MAEQVITDRYAIYNGDCVEVMKNIPDESVDMTVYSPPFGGVYQYSSDDRDLSNSKNYDDFFNHYEYVVAETWRLLKPGRIAIVHCTDIPKGNASNVEMIELPDDILKLHKKYGFEYVGRYSIWKEPLEVRNRTYMKKLFHVTLCENATKCSLAAADYMLVMRKKGEEKEKVRHPYGMTEYFGDRKPPIELLKYRGWQGSQLENRYSHWVFRQYASAFWDDVRVNRVLPFIDSKDENDERHVHPLQLDAIDRVIQLWSNEGDTILTPFMGVGSEVHEAVRLNRKGIGIELKESYFNQAKMNLQNVDITVKQEDLFTGLEKEAHEKDGLEQCTT
jgi:DNA modification methylase